MIFRCCCLPTDCSRNSMRVVAASSGMMLTCQLKSRLFGIPASGRLEGRKELARTLSKCSAHIPTYYMKFDHTQGVGKCIDSAETRIGRVYSTQFLTVLLRSRIPNFEIWGIPLIIQQTKDHDRSVALAAIEVLEEACHEKVRLLVEADTHSSLTLHNRNEEGYYSRRNCNTRPIIIPPNIPAHLYGQLVQTTQGTTALRKFGDLPQLIDVVCRSKVLTNRNVWNLRQLYGLSLTLQRIQME
ncbi:Rapamycin-insensitive companion of mTOR [Eumeta japonica]|uniref:Rapamycin-insensitive companion of mTOR n=1 Tax=Eumeta variegata TaxID=151549 RepID=A0A4C1TF20_EUMVA|nr:Rapamycin-insensitive companion of mTOR [Eumeta japonica]